MNLGTGLRQMFVVFVWHLGVEKLAFNVTRNLVMLLKWVEKQKNWTWSSFICFFLCVRYLIRRACLHSRVQPSCVLFSSERRRQESTWKDSWGFLPTWKVSRTSFLHALSRWNWLLYGKGNLSKSLLSPGCLWANQQVYKPNNLFLCIHSD